MSSRIAGGSGSFGAGGCADAVSVAFGAGVAVLPVMAGATTFVFVAAGTSGLTAAFVIFGPVFSCFSADLALAFVADAVPSLDEATAGSAFGSVSLVGSFFAT